MPSDNGDISTDRVDDENGLGVTTDNKLTFRKHMANKVSVANMNLGISFRTLTYLSQEMFIILIMKTRLFKYRDFT